ncbi:uncharacterized protein LOC135834958 [Planococcus citri]|uniref:uncharacterized protein LOC135834958 n=1 Tax=Planococcus citri TaxID=170843 RepID=UPI0031F9CB51
MEYLENLVPCNKSALRPCGNIAACIKHPTMRAYCVCTHTGAPMYKDTRCTLNLVNTDQLNNESFVDSNITHIYIPNLASENITEVAQSSNVLTENWFITFAIVLIIIAICIFLIRKCYCGFHKRQPKNTTLKNKTLLGKNKSGIPI